MIINADHHGHSNKSRAVPGQREVVPGPLLCAPVLKPAAAALD